MINNDKKLIYLAGPFFNPEELARMQKLETLCTQYRHLPLSPRDFFVLKPDASMGDRRAVFHKNCQWIEKADIILACTDKRDVGTLWEMGYARGKDKCVVAFSEEPADRVNVMLAQGCTGWIRGWASLEGFLEGRMLGHAEVEESGNLWDFRWDEVHKWKNEVY